MQEVGGILWNFVAELSNKSKYFCLMLHALLAELTECNIPAQ